MPPAVRAHFSGVARVSSLVLLVLLVLPVSSVRSAPAPAGTTLHAPGTPAADEEGWLAKPGAPAPSRGFAQPGPGAPAPSRGFAQPGPGAPAPSAGPGPAPLAPPIGSAFAIASPMVADGRLAARGMERGKRKPPGDPAGEERAARRGRGMAGLPAALSGERSRVMLQSLTVPGWGQATNGERREALAFGLLELGVWTCYAAFRIQEHMRSETYEGTARLFAGIELEGRDEEYRRLVGLYRSSEDYNRLVVRRDAVILHFSDPAAYQAYIAMHEVKGNDAWSWGSDQDLLRYRAERQAAQRATKRAHDALAAAAINRLLSVVHASRPGARAAADRTSWKLECVPEAGDRTGVRLGLRADF